MSCDKFRADLTAYLDGELADRGLYPELKVVQVERQLAGEVVDDHGLVDMQRALVGARKAQWAQTRVAYAQLCRQFCAGHAAPTAVEP